jgi:tetratricopeptide (TPR) repeat protein
MSELTSAERALFHGEPQKAGKPLRLVYEADPTEPRARWLYAVWLGALGRYPAAAAVLAPAVRTDPLAATARASHLRQLERHAEAERLDQRALSLAPPGTDAHADALIGLVADAVGRAHVDHARSRLEAATAALAGVAGVPSAVESLLSAPNGWRSRVRLAWVAAEVALLTDQPEDAVRHARAAVRTAEAARAPRHLTKSLLFRGVAEQVAGDPGALGSLGAAAHAAERFGLLPLLWPARLVRSRLLAATHPEAARLEAAAAVQVRQTLASWGS